MGIDLAVDFGISCTDVVIRDRTSGSLTYHSRPSLLELTSKAAEALLLQVGIQPSEVKQVALTGGSHDTIKQLFGIDVVNVNEVQAIGNAVQSLYPDDPDAAWLCISCGSGTATATVKDGETQHQGGTPMGGGTIMGLSKLALGNISVDQFSQLADKGDKNEAHLLIGDVISGDIGSLPKDATAVHFGKLLRSDTLPSHEDIAAGISEMVGSTIAIMACQIFFRTQVDKICLIGRTPKITSVRKAIEKVFNFYKLDFNFPANHEFGTVLGALKQLDLDDSHCKLGA